MGGGSVGCRAPRPSPGIGGMLGLYQERSSGSTVMRLHRQLQKQHRYKLSYMVTRLALQRRGWCGPLTTLWSPIAPAGCAISCACRSNVASGLAIFCGTPV
jgi:hypothetical protein